MTHSEAIGAGSARVPPTDCAGELAERRPSIPRALTAGHRVYRCPACRATIGMVGGKVVWWEGPPASSYIRGAPS